MKRFCVTFFVIFVVKISPFWIFNPFECIWYIRSCATKYVLFLWLRCEQMLRWSTTLLQFYVCCCGHWSNLCSHLVNMFSHSKSAWRGSWGTYISTIGLTSCCKCYQNVFFIPCYRKWGIHFVTQLNVPMLGYMQIFVTSMTRADA